ncbi:MAG: elongation factor G [Nitrospiraceae bacterium]|nr:MAG: elongation factor G [Nitrospiraceae bacterium]
MGIDVGKIRNIAVIAGGGAGKTSLVEAVLFDTKAIERMGSVETENTTTDFEPEEINRKMSISSSPAYCDWKGHRINLVDTPGFINFLEDTKCCLSAVDGAVVVVGARVGVKAETGKVWQYANEYSLPRIVFINKMDKENASFQTAVEGVEKSYGVSLVPITVPMGEGPAFSGVIDLLKMKAVTFKEGMPVEGDIPDEYKAFADESRKQLIEKVAESDDDMLEKYLEGTDPTEDEIKKGIKKGTLSGAIIPVLCGSAIANIGVQPLLDTILTCLSSPVDRASQSPVMARDTKTDQDVEIKPAADQPVSLKVFKTIADPFAGKLNIFRVYSGILKSDSALINTTKDRKEKMGNMFYLIGKKQVPVKEVGPGEIAAVAKLKEAQTGDSMADPAHPVLFETFRTADPMISYAIEPKSRGDEEKVGTGLNRLLEEDPALKFHRDEESAEMILGGTGQMHIEITLEKLKRKFGVEVNMKSPQIPYRETIKKAASAQGRYKKQSGGRGQFGDCWIKIEPLPRGGGFEFENQIVGGAIPRQYIPAVEKGIVEKMKDGLLAGYPVVDIKVSLYDGSYHSVDSSEMAFKIAGSMALQKAAPEAKATILEPIVKVEVSTPEEFLGNVIGDLNSKRGKVQGVDSLSSGEQKVAALVPMAEMLTYANQLNSLTSGQGVYTMEPSHYEEVPAHVAQQLIAEKNEEKKEA